MPMKTIFPCTNQLWHPLIEILTTPLKRALFACIERAVISNSLCKASKNSGSKNRQYNLNYRNVPKNLQVTFSEKEQKSLPKLTSKKLKSLKFHYGIHSIAQFSI